jgi:C_GCAxxG_C_C family probable redox protein
MDTHNRAQLAVSRFKDGFSCSQAVLSAFSDTYGLDLPLYLKISQPFGGGIAHLGDICGAVSEALMVIGLKYGWTKAEDIRAREKRNNTTCSKIFFNCNIVFKMDLKREI